MPGPSARQRSGLRRRGYAGIRSEYGQALEIAAPVGVVTVAVAAAILVAWLGSEVVTAGGSDAEKTAWGIGVGGITAGLSAAFVDPLKDGGINARRIRAAFRRTFQSDSDLPINLRSRS